MKLLSLAVVAIQLPLMGCDKSPDPSPTGAVDAPRSAEIVKAIRVMVRANNLVARCKNDKEGDLPAAERDLAESRAALTALQEKALKVLPDSDYKARARLRWSWLGASLDMADEPGGRVRKERTEEANKALRDLDRAIELDSNDAESLILRGRLVLLEGVELHFFGLAAFERAYPADTVAERLREFQIDPLLGEISRFSPADQASRVPAACDRAIADFSRAIATHAREAEGFYWRGMAFWYKVLYIVENPMATRDREQLQKAVASDLDQAKRNVEQARFLMPQDGRYQRICNEVSSFWGRDPVAAPIRVNLIPIMSEAEVFKAVAAGVVLITAQLNGGTASGSGSLMSKSGLVLTNKHVVEGARSITAASKDGRKFKAALVATHEVYDLALIRLVGEVGSLPVLSFDDQHPKVGEGIVIIGHPSGMTWSLTAGKVSQFRNSERDPGKAIFLQTDAAINPGNSGGPMLNLRGLIVGVVTSKLRDREGQAFAISRDVAAPFVLRYQ